MAHPMNDPAPRTPDSHFYWNYVVAVNLRRLRLARGLSQVDVTAEMARHGMPVITGSALSNLESGRVNGDDGGARDTPRTSVSVDRLMSLALVLGVTYLELLREDTLPRDDDDRAGREPGGTSGAKTTRGSEW